ncbi:MAG TPA: carboxypeptidase-like regulatory domain-containing protein, partial [Nitrospiraceae bacterium]|nr:carboxypeptidase-like regulatory domain-containing protein [Nitrospiraceae bacterium]
MKSCESVQHLRIWSGQAMVVLLMLVVAAALGRAEENTVTLSGTVVAVESSGTHSAIPGATVTLSGVDVSRKVIADDRGSYSFTIVPPGRYGIEAVAPGLQGSATIDVKAAQSVDVLIVMTIASLKESVTVNADTEATMLVDSQQQTEITRSTILNSPTKDDRADTLLPLIPGVVRGPDGLINMKGARSSQGGALLNSASVADPATGIPAMNLPIDVVQSTTVISNPYDPEYGRNVGAVSKVETTTGNFNNFHVSLQNVFVRPRKRDGDFVGIESATPRTTITGPLVKDKIAFTESFEYRFIRTPVESLPQLQRDMKFEGFTWFNQVDANLSSRQTMTASFMLNPQKLNYLGLNTFTPQPSTPDLHQRGEMAAVQHRFAISSDSLLVSQFSFKRFDVDVTANSGAPYEQTVETTNGGFFDQQARRSKHTEWREIYQFERRGPLGSHLLKVGTD